MSSRTTRRSREGARPTHSELEFPADRDDRMELFHRRLEAFRKRHRRKPTLLERLVAVGLARPAR